MSSVPEAAEQTTAEGSHPEQSARTWCGVSAPSPSLMDDVQLFSICWVCVWPRLAHQTCLRVVCSMCQMGTSLDGEPGSICGDGWNVFI